MNAQEDFKVEVTKATTGLPLTESQRILLAAAISADAITITTVN